MEPPSRRGAVFLILSSSFRLPILCRITRVGRWENTGLHNIIRTYASLSEVGRRFFRSANARRPDPARTSRGQLVAHDGEAAGGRKKHNPWSPRKADAGPFSALFLLRLCHWPADDADTCESRPPALWVLCPCRLRFASWPWPPRGRRLPRWTEHRKGCRM